MSERGVVSSVYILFVPFGCSTLPLHSALWPMAIPVVEFQISCARFDVSKGKVTCQIILNCLNWVLGVCKTLYILTTNAQEYQTICSETVL